MASAEELKNVLDRDATVQAHGAQSPDIEILAASDSPACHEAIALRLSTAQRIGMIGIGVNVLNSTPITDSMLSRASRGECTVEIYLADDTHPSVQLRLIEEDLRFPGTYPAGVSAQALFTKLLKWGSKPNVIFGLFTHYPTYAIVIADDHYFVYPYGYATIGNYSPVTHFIASNPHNRALAKFFDEQCDLIRGSAVDANRAIMLRKRIGPGIAVTKTDLVAFAVFFIPPQQSALYNWGSQVVGYDVRAVKVLEPSPTHIGSAHPYGFHLTICDVLFFLNSSEADKARAHVAALESLPKRL